MARGSVTLLCYWNGKKTKGEHGIAYEGAAPRPIRVNHGITHNELLDKMYTISGFDRKQFELKIVCRYPVTLMEYIAVPIEDDQSVDLMLEVPCNPGVHCVEIYLEQVPIRIDSQANTTQEDMFNPGPIDGSVLVLQHEHRSGAIWTGQNRNILTCRQRLARFMREWPLDHRVRPYIIQAGFYGVYRVGFIQLDWTLITALVERWRQETHTFHLAVGESTITLQDTAVLLGLRVHGDPVTGTTDVQWPNLCEELLGRRPDGNSLQGSALKLSWLRMHFLQPPSDADDLIVQQYARAYILALIGGALFADKSGSDVQLIFLPLLRDFVAAGRLSWGSATLAHLYRELCRASKAGASEIAGPLILLQLWAWERLHVGRPEKRVSRSQHMVIPRGECVGAEPPFLDVADGAVINDQTLPVDPLGCMWRVPLSRIQNPHGVLMLYRDQLDQQKDDQMIWQPYTQEILSQLPEICTADQHVWRTVAPLICFDIVEWHHPDRVLRQFGFRQGIPRPCDTNLKLHSIDRRGRHDYCWWQYHAQYIDLWAAREQSIVSGEPEQQPMSHYDPYMEWYRSITRRFVTPLADRSNTGFQPTAVTTHLLVQSLTNIHKQCGMTVSAFNSDDAHSALINIQTICSDVLRLIGEGRQLEVAHKLAPPPPSVAREPVRQQCRGRARGGRHGIIHPAAVSSLVSPATLAISLPDASVKARDDKPFLAPSLAAMSASAASPKPQTPSDPDSIEGPSRVAQEVASSILSTTIMVSSIRKRSRGRGSSKGHLCGPTENVGIPIVIPVDRSSSQPPPSPRVASKATVRLEGLAQVTQGAASTPLAELASLATPLDTAPSPSMVLSEAMTSSTTVDINPIEGLSEVIDKSAATPPPTSASPSDDFIEGMSRSTQVAALAPPPTAATPLVISANVAPLSPSAVASEAVVSSIAPPPSVISSIKGPSQVTKNAASAPSPIRVTAPPSEGQGRGKVVRVDLTKTMPTSSAMPSDPPASLLNIISKRAKHL